jgi:hypothetical protein
MSLDEESVKRNEKKTNTVGNILSHMYYIKIYLGAKNSKTLQ